ncbi:MAG: hypothetical protein J5809_00330 [Selenomonadaceae bacterium]|nr:hypothetical protein [Selenomonadaceae bacterium]
MKIFKLAILAVIILANNLAQAAALADSVNGFSWKYFRALNHDRNIFYSPYSIAAALSLVANGATGETQREILNALDADSLETLNDGFQNFRAESEKNYADENILRDAKLILVSKNFIGNGINPAFRKTAEKVYGSEIRAANFSGNLTGEKRKITAWVDKITNHFLPNYQSSASSATVVDLLNVVYFKGKWNFPFEEYATRERIFTGRNGETASVPMMRQVFEEDIAYAENEKFKAVALPYKNFSAMMYVILPKDETDLNIADAFDESFIAQIAAARRFNGEVDVILPKFELDIKNSLVDDLKAIGIERAFSNGAEFSKIVEKVQLQISGATHQAKVKVDETGTEAAAVTEFTLEATSAVPRPKTRVEFHADRPFIFVIRDTQSGVDLFAGAVNFLK